MISPIKSPISITVKRGTISKKPVLYKNPEAIINTGPSKITPKPMSGYLKYEAKPMSPFMKMIA